jgi:signal transduction histidine kinase
MRWLPRELRSRVLVSSGLQLLLVGTALGLLGFSAGQQQGLEQLAAERSRHRLTRLSENLAQRLEGPLLINRANGLAIRQGWLRLNDFEQLAQQFWRQMQLYPVGYINFGATDGRFIGVERLDSGQLVLNEDNAAPLGRGRLGVYRLSPDGRRGALLEVVEGMTTFHQEAWYADTVKADRPTWSRIYQWEDKPHVFAISYNEPVRSAGGTLQGVIGVDFVLSQLSTWLQQLWQGVPGLALIVEPDGQVVASSRPELTLVTRNGQRRRARLAQLSAPLARAAATGLRTRQGDASAPIRTVRLGGEDYTLQALPWGQPQGLNWLLITVTSDDNALKRSQQQIRLGLMLGVLALAGALLLNQQVIRWLLAPMELLQARARQAVRDPAQPFEASLPAGSAAELVAMAAALGELVQDLQDSERALAQAAQRERVKDAQALQLLKLKLRSSLEAAAIAHEIKAPLSQILLRSQLLLSADATEQGSAAACRPELTAIASAAEQVLTTIEQMRCLLRNVQTSHQRLDLATVASSALLYLQPAAGKAGVELGSTGLDSPCWIEGDSAQLQIAIVNLLRNSVEALQGQRGPRRIALQLHTTVDEAVLQIEDNGPGLPARSDLLEPLSSAQPKGSGLGLFVVQTTMDNHGGRLSLGRSARLKGAAVTLVLPRLVDLPSNG